MDHDQSTSVLVLMDPICSDPVDQVIHPNQNLTNNHHPSVRKLWPAIHTHFPPYLYSINPPPALHTSADALVTVSHSFSSSHLLSFFYSAISLYGPDTPSSSSAQAHRDLL
jgi:hypothetical protein